MSLLDEVGVDGLDGLSQLRALIASGRKPGILIALDFEFVEVEAGVAVFEGTPGEHAYNPIGKFAQIGMEKIRPAPGCQNCCQLDIRLKLARRPKFGCSCITALSTAPPTIAE